MGQSLPQHGRAGSARAEYSRQNSICAGIQA
jgi:hypothetical protein